MDQNTCNVCNKSFHSEQELRDHQRTAHSTGKQNPSSEHNQPNRGEQNPQQDRGERKIAS